MPQQEEIEELSFQDELRLRVMRVLEENPEASQRQIARELDVSLGGVNYCLKALVDRGWVKLENFQRSPNKLGYLYLLTPTGIAAKAQLTAKFLTRKLAEYEALKAEINELRSEVERAEG